MKFHNRTRTAESIPSELIRKNQWHLLPLYYMAQLSFLGQEAIQNSGSYTFADHVYAARPKGKWGIGYVIDAVFLNLPSARSMRNRYLLTKKELYQIIHQQTHDEPIHILALPSGLARELFELNEELEVQGHPAHQRIHWHGLDLDAELVDKLNKQVPHDRMSFVQADAFDPSGMKHAYDAIISLGFGEFVDDTNLVTFYQHIHRNLKPGGTFITSSMQKHVISDYLMRNLAQLHTHYRDAKHLEQLHQRAGFRKITTYRDSVGLQTMAVSIKDS